MLRVQKAVSVLMSFLFVLTTFPVEANAQTASPSGTRNSSSSGPPVEYKPLTAEELDSIVAPIALYPDALVAQILGAATFPYEIVDATLWLKDNSQLKGEALAKAVDQQSWDPAVKALTQFPSVLDNLSKNLAWTSALGEASATQQADVMAAVQRMRAKAQAAGNLKSSPEIKVVQESPQTIVIQPANPQIVYVPVYNPAVIYGVPYVYPGYVYVAPPPSTAVIAFGVGIAVGAMVYGGCCGWGWSYWGHQLARQHHSLQSQRLHRKQLLAWWLLRGRLSSGIPRVSSRQSRISSGLSGVRSSSRLSSTRYNPSKSGQSPRQSSSRHDSSKCRESPECSRWRFEAGRGEAEHSASQWREPSEPDSGHTTQYE